MKHARRRELPPDRQPDLRRALRLEIITLVYGSTRIFLMYLVMGSSQTMKTVWIEDLLSLVPAIAFLIAVSLRDRPPNEQFPYGYHRAVSIAFLVGSAALLAMGLFLSVESVVELFRTERPTVGSVVIFGKPIWLGWLMLLALSWSAIPPYFLGRAKLEPARRLHDKVLHADAEMSAADWKVDISAFVGVLGIAVGWWWLDRAAALLIALDLMYDGARSLRACVFDLMDRTPHVVGDGAKEALPARLTTELRKLPWVADARVRLRECGHVFYGEAFVRPRDHRNLMERLEEASERLHAVDWRVEEIVIQLDESPFEPGAEDSNSS